MPISSQPLRHLWVPPAFGAVLVGKGGVDSVAVLGTTSATFTLPPDLLKLVSADFVIDNVLGATGDLDFDLTSDYGDMGEAVTANSETDNSTLYPFVAGKVGKVSAMSVLTGVGPGHTVDVQLTNQTAALVYNRGMLVSFLCRG